LYVNHITLTARKRTYTKDEILDNHRYVLCFCGDSTKYEEHYLLSLYWLDKVQKCPNDVARRHSLRDEQHTCHGGNANVDIKFSVRMCLVELKPMKMDLTPFACTFESSPFIHNTAGHVITGDLNIINDTSLQRAQIILCPISRFGMVYGILRHFHQYFSYIVAVSFIGGGN
jgi:hypothetical protein